MNCALLEMQLYGLKGGRVCRDSGVCVTTFVCGVPDFFPIHWDLFFEDVFLVGEECVFQYLAFSGFLCKCISSFIMKDAHMCSDTGKSNSWSSLYYAKNL